MRVSTIVKMEYIGEAKGQALAAHVRASQAGEWIMKSLQSLAVVTGLMIFAMGSQAQADTLLPVPMCVELDDQLSQVSYYQKVAEKLTGSDRSVLIPVGHFTTYVQAEEALTIVEARAQLLASQIKSTGCDILMESVALKDEQPLEKFYSLNM